MTLSSETFPSISAGGRELLDAIFRNPGISQADLTKRLGLSQPSVARLINGFAKIGLVELGARKVDRPGHPSVSARINPRFAASLGASILNDTVSLTLIDCAGGVLGQRRAALPNMSRTEVIGRLLAFKRDLLADAGVDHDALLGLGIGISAFFAPDGLKMVGPPALEDWSLIDFRPELESAFGLTVTLENDGACAANGENLFGVGRTVSNFAYLHLTNGFGGGIISSGRLFRGHRGNAGEFGGIWTVGKLGYPSLDRLLQLTVGAATASPNLSELLSVITLETPGVEIWLSEAVPAFANLGSILGYAIDPEAIVIGGRLPSAVADELIRRIELPRAPNRHDLSPSPPLVMRSTLTSDAVALGAAVLPIQRAMLA